MRTEPHQGLFRSDSTSIDETKDMSITSINSMKTEHRIGNKRKILGALTVVALLAVGGYWLAGRGGQPSAGTGENDISVEAIADIKNYEYTEEFRDSKGRFSFSFPPQFTVTEIPGSPETILIQDPASGIGIQILITQFGEDTDITADMVRRDIPNMRIEDVQEVEIGPNRKGIAFLSDNPAFNGRSRDVWFVYKKELYQITTYAEQDEFLKKMFSTWVFHE